MTRPLCVIPDIHGQKADLDRVLCLIAAHEGRDVPVVFLGDYTDRGPDSRGVIETLIAGLEAGHDWTPLRGNHDQLFLDALDGQLSDAAFARWNSGNMGGRETLASYGVEWPVDAAWRAQVPDSHRRFLSTLPYTHETEALFLCHAGISPGTPLDRQVPEDLLWIREPFLYDSRDHGKLVVHGHTPVDRPEHHGNRVALDTGAGWGRTLQAAVFEGRDVWVLTDEGRLPLTPP
ncbi:MAG: metallophosphoesterase family protein [Roseovarius sp.]